MSARVVLVRGARSVAGAGGGCCSGDVRPFDAGGGAHCHAPPADEVGEVYRVLRTGLPDDIAVEIVSPANWLWLLPTLIRDGRRLGLRGGALRRSVRAGMAVASLVVDGAVLASGGLPPPDAALDAVRKELVRARPSVRTAGGPTVG